MLFDFLMDSIPCSGLRSRTIHALSSQSGSAYSLPATKPPCLQRPSTLRVKPDANGPSLEKETRPHFYDTAIVDYAGILIRDSPFGRRLMTLRFTIAFIACLITRYSSAQTFSDQTLAAGINHVQTTAAQASGIDANTFLTGGVAAGDFDGDGYSDLIFTRLNDTDILYRNQGDGTFQPQTTAAGFNVSTLTNGVVSGDIDNDGDLDLYMTATGGTRNYLYLNDGNGFFTDAGTSREVALANGVIRQGQGASFGDYDNDGHLDLITSDWRQDAADSQSRLFRNLGGQQSGEFEDVTVAAGVDTYRTSTSWRFSPRLVDLDRDGHLDLAVASDFNTSQLFWNNGDGSFTDGTLPAGVGTDRNGMGSTFGDYDGDGDLDWFITNITADPNHPGGFGGFNRLYRNDGNRQFTDVTQEAGLRDSRWSWGTTFFDYDNDGDSDLIATNGYNGPGFEQDQTYLWRNDNGVFTDVSNVEGIVDTGQGRGLAHLDYDNDGDLDLVIVNNEDQPVLYRNDSNNGNDFLRVDLEGVLSNRDGIGAFITVTPDLDNPDEQIVWEVDGGSSFLSQNEHTAHFGLGHSDGTVDMIQVEWSSGLIQQSFYVDANQTIELVETDQAALADFNGNGTVDAADFVVWRDLLGTESTVADGDGNGVVGIEDYHLWRSQFGRVVGVAVPEPNSGWILLAIALVTLKRRGLSGAKKNLGFLRVC